MGLADIARAKQIQKQLDRLQSVQDAEERDRHAYKFATYQGKDPVDGTDIVEVNGAKTSGFKLMSNAPLSIGDRVNLRPNQQGLQRVDSKNVAPVIDQAPIELDITEYYFGLNYVYFAAVFETSSSITIILEGAIFDLTIRAFAGGGEISYSLTGNTFEFTFITVGEFAIEYRRETDGLACVFVFVNAGVTSSPPIVAHSGIQFSREYTYAVCGVKNNDQLSFLDSSSITIFNNAKSLKSKINILLATNTVFRAYMNLGVEVVSSSFDPVYFPAAQNIEVAFDKYPQYAQIIFSDGLPPTSDLLTFTLKKNKKQKGKIVKKFDSLEMKTLKTNQQISCAYQIIIQEVGSSAYDPIIDSFGLTSISLSYIDLDTDPYEVLDTSGTSGSGELYISGLSGIVTLTEPRKIIVGMSVTTISYWIDFYARYGLIDTERIYVLLSYTVDSDPETTTDLYISAYTSISVQFEIPEATDLSFSFQFRRESGSTWLQV